MITKQDMFWARVDKRGPDECWEWKGPRRGGNDGSRSYGSYRLDGRDSYAHRASYTFHVGPIPADHEIHHECQNKLCVNPAHLRAIPRTEHRGLNQHAIKTQCPKGHPYDEDNTYRWRGSRYCRICRHVRVTASNERVAEARLAIRVGKARVPA